MYRFYNVRLRYTRLQKQIAQFNGNFDVIMVCRFKTVFSTVVKSSARQMYIVLKRVFFYVLFGGYVNSVDEFVFVEVFYDIEFVPNKSAIAA